jgi:hypothetical protein
MLKSTKINTNLPYQCTGSATSHGAIRLKAVEKLPFLLHFMPVKFDILGSGGRTDNAGNRARDYPLFW